MCTYIKWRDKLLSEDFQNNLWTLLASGIAPIYLFLVIFITVRIIGLAESGVVSFAIAVAIQSQILIVLGGRLFQGSDIKEKFSFSSYLWLRVCSSITAILFIVLFLVVGNFEQDRSAVVLLFFIIYLIDGLAEVFMEDLQQKGKMRVAGRMRVCAFGASFVILAIAMLYIGTIITPLILSSVVVFVVYFIWIWCYRKHFGSIKLGVNAHIVKKLAWNVVPLFLGTFAFSYLINMQKYYLGFLSTDETVAIIAMLVMPGTALYVLSISIFGGAEMTKTAQMLNAGKTMELSRRINMQLLIAGFFSVLFVLCAYIFGVPLLSIVFSTDLSPYKSEFMKIVLGGALFTVFAVLYSAIVVMRLQKAFLLCITTIAIVIGPSMWFVVAQYDFTGAAFTNIVILWPLSVALYVIYRTAVGRLMK